MVAQSTRRQRSEVRSSFEADHEIGSVKPGPAGDDRGLRADAPGNPRLEIDPWDQIRNCQHAITYAQGQPHVDVSGSECRASTRRERLRGRGDRPACPVACRQFRVTSVPVLGEFDLRH